LLAAGACTEIGPVAVKGPDPQQPSHNAFPGLANLLGEVPSGGSLNVFVIHGMRTSADESEFNLRESIAKRLNLTLEKQQQQVLPMARPDIVLHGKSLWDGRAATGTWSPCASSQLGDCDAPYLDINTYTAPGDRKVVFYSLNYWGTLVWIKCTQMVAPDTQLTGDFTLLGLGNAEYCNKRFKPAPGIAPGEKAASSPPQLLDHAIKNLIMVWGFGDAAIVMSGYEKVLREEVRLGLAAEREDVAQRMHAPFSDANKQQFQRYAMISESLGSYILMDTLGYAADDDLYILCRSSQVHMLANQISLLRLSQIRATTALTGGVEKPETASDPAPHQQCWGAPGSRAVVAYHDPSDLLTFYVPPPGLQPAYVQQLQAKNINVVVPFAPLYVPGVLANPVQAHSGGQEQDQRIQDMVSFGSDGTSPNDHLVLVPQ
jgi:hypothetical protein